MHVDLNSIISALSALLLGYFTFKQNSKKSDMDSVENNRDYIVEQNKRLNAENKELHKENDKLRKELSKNEAKH